MPPISTVSRAPTAARAGFADRISGVEWWAPAPPGAEALGRFEDGDGGKAWSAIDLAEGQPGVFDLAGT